MEVDQTNQ
jgi:serine/threonine protein kinase